MKKYVPLYLGIIMIFILQLVSYSNYLLNYGGLYNGILDKYLLFKTPLVVLPILLVVYGIINIIIDSKKE